MSSSPIVNYSVSKLYFSYMCSIY